MIPHSRKIISWNCNGLRASVASSEDKLNFFDKEYPNGSFGIAAFVESHHRNLDDLPIRFQEYTPTHHLVHTPAPMSHPHRGIILLVSKAFELISWKEIIPGRLLNIKIKDKEKDKIFNLSAFYGPVQRNVTRANVEELVQHFVKLHTASEHNIILGDFNFIDNPLDKSKGLDSHDKMIGRFWEHFKKTARVGDPYREQFPSTKIFSYHNKTGKSRGDRVYVSDRLIYSVSNIKYIYYPQANTHKLLSFTFQQSQEKGPGYWKMNTSILNDPTYVKLVTDTISETNTLVCETPAHWWELLLIHVRSVTVTYSQKKKFFENEVKRVWTRELVDLEAVPVQSLTTGQLERLKVVQERLKLIEEKEVEGHRVRSRLIPKYEISDPNVSFFAKLEKRHIEKSSISCLKDENGIEKRDAKGLLDITHKYYKPFFTNSDTVQISQKKLLQNIQHKFSSSQRELLDAPINQEELEKADEG